MLGVGGRIEYNYKSQWCRKNTINITSEEEGVGKKILVEQNKKMTSLVATGTQRATFTVTRQATGVVIYYNKKVL